MVIAPDGSRLVRKAGGGSVSEAGPIGSRLGAALLADGAREILDEVFALADQRGAPIRDSAV